MEKQINPGDRVEMDTGKRRLQGTVLAVGGGILRIRWDQHPTQPTDYVYPRGASDFSITPL